MEDIKFISVEDKLPIAEDITDECNPYYLVKLPRYGFKQAMYLENEIGERGWYLDYTSKIIVEVTHWAKI